MRCAGSVSTPEGRGPGDHVCWVHDDRAAWRHTAVAFLREGAAGGDKLLYIADDRTPGLVDDLAALPARDTMLTSGQLVVMPAARAYGAAREHDVARQAEGFRTLTADAAAAGYRGVRVAAEVTSMAATEEDARRFVAAELQTDRMVHRNPVQTLCGVDQRRTGARACSAVRFVHPLRHGGPSGDEHCGLHAEDGGWRLRGQLDVVTATHLETALAALPDIGDAHLEVADLEFVDIAGVRALLGAVRHPPVRRLVLHHPSRLLARLLDVAGERAAFGVRVSHAADAVSVDLVGVGGCPRPPEDERREAG